MIYDYFYLFTSIFSFENYGKIITFWSSIIFVLSINPQKH